MLFIKLVGGLNLLFWGVWKFYKFALITIHKPTELFDTLTDGAFVDPLMVSDNGIVRARCEVSDRQTYLKQQEKLITYGLNIILFLPSYCEIHGITYKEGPSTKITYSLFDRKSAASRGFGGT